MLKHSSRIRKYILGHCEYEPCTPDALLDTSSLGAILPRAPTKDATPLLRKCWKCACSRSSFCRWSHQVGLAPPPHSVWCFRNRDLFLSAVSLERWSVVYILMVPMVPSTCQPTSSCSLSLCSGLHLPYKHLPLSLSHRTRWNRLHFGIDHSRIGPPDRQ